MSRSVTLLIAVAMLISACSGSEGDSNVVLYSGRSQELMEPILEQFTAESGIDVQANYADSAELALLVAEEGDGSPADVFLSQSPGATGFLIEQGLLADLDDAVLDAVPAGFRNQGGRWVGVTGRVRVLVYNQDLVSEADLPASVFDVTAPEFAGQVAVAPTNGSFQDFVTAMRQIEGDDAALGWLTAMADGDAPTYSNNSGIVDAVARGEVSMGLVNHYYNLRALAEDPSVPSRNHFFPAGDLGGLVIVTAAGILESSDNVEAAQELIVYLLSENAQDYFATETQEYALATGSAPEGLPSLDSLDSPLYDVDALGGGLARTADLIDMSGLAGS